MRASMPGRAGYRDIDLYAPERSPCRIDLSDNTNAWGMPPAARAAMDVVAGSPRYPSLYAEELKRALGVYTGMPPAWITTGCGSDDVLDSAIRALTEPGDRLAYVAPTFPMIPIFARLNGLVPVPCALKDLARSGARLLYICSPNNPTGELVDRGAIKRVLKSASADQVIIVDEAYFEFCGTTVIDLLRSCDRLLVTRTMSKAFGLAGLRVGYALGNPALIAEVEKSRGPYKVSAVAEAAGVAALTDGLDWVRKHIARTIVNRERLLEELCRRRLPPLPSAANFVFVPLAGSIAIARAMRDRGVAVRAFDEPAGLRITVGEWSDLADVLTALDEARSVCS
jgi:histidinol-phosphate aminotransferase